MTQIHRCWGCQEDFTATDPTTHVCDENREVLSTFERALKAYVNQQVGGGGGDPHPHEPSMISTDDFFIALGDLLNNWKRPPELHEPEPTR